MPSHYSRWSRTSTCYHSTPDTLPSTHTSRRLSRRGQPPAYGSWQRNANGSHRPSIGQESDLPDFPPAVATSTYARELTFDLGPNLEWQNVDGMRSSRVRHQPPERSTISNSFFIQIPTVNFPTVTLPTVHLPSTITDAALYGVVAGALFVGGMYLGIDLQANQDASLCSSVG